MKKIILSLLIEFVFFTACTPCFIDSNKNWVLKHECEGTITNKYIDTFDRSSAWVVFERGDTSSMDGNIYPHLEINDYIVKKLKTLNYIIIRDRDTICLTYACESATHCD